MGCASYGAAVEGVTCESCPLRFIPEAYWDTQRNPEEIRYPEELAEKLHGWQRDIVETKHGLPEELVTLLGEIHDNYISLHDRPDFFALTHDDQVVLIDGWSGAVPREADLPPHAKALAACMRRVSAGCEPPDPAAEYAALPIRPTLAMGANILDELGRHGPDADVIAQARKIYAAWGDIMLEVGEAPSGNERILNDPAAARAYLFVAADTVRAFDRFNQEA